MREGVNNDEKQKKILGSLTFIGSGGEFREGLRECMCITSGPREKLPMEN